MGRRSMYCTWSDDSIYGTTCKIAAGLAIAWGVWTIWKSE